MQYLWFHLFGINEISVRLTSVISGIAILPLLLYFRSKIEASKNEIGLAIIILATSPLFIKNHTFKTGDYDALLTLFMLAYALQFYVYTITRSNKNLVYFFVFLLLASMTKGIAAFLFCPALLIYSLKSSTLKHILSSKTFYISLSVFLATFLGYYFARESVDAGYIAAVIKNELGGRFLEVTENHAQKPSFYFSFLLEKSLGFWLVTTPFFIIYFRKKIASITDFEKFAFLILLLHLIIISISQTKLYWYMLPWFPLFCFLLSKFICRVLGHNLLYILCLTLVPMYMQIQSVRRTNNYDDSYIEYENSVYLRKYRDCKFGTLKIIEKDYFQHTRFYVERINLGDCYVEFKNADQVEIGDMVLFSDSKIKNTIYEKFNHELVDSIKNVQVLKLLSIKE